MNEVLEHEIPQLQEIAGKTRKKEEELKQLKSELAALDRKIQLELAQPISCEQILQSFKISPIMQENDNDIEPRQQKSESASLHSSSVIELNHQHIANDYYLNVMNKNKGITI